MGNPARHNYEAVVVQMPGLVRSVYGIDPSQPVSLTDTDPELQRKKAIAGRNLLSAIFDVGFYDREVDVFDETVYSDTQLPLLYTVHGDAHV